MADKRGSSGPRVLVSEIYQLALPPGTRVAGGEAGLSKGVEWVAPLRATFPLFGTMGKSYLALVSMQLARRADPSLTVSYLINELRRVEAAALVVDEPVSDVDAALADTEGMPLLVVPPSTDLHEVERAIVRTLVDREGQLARREMEIREQLQSLFSREGVQSVLDQLGGLFSGQVQVVDDGGHLAMQSATSVEPVIDLPKREFPIIVAGLSMGKLVMRAAQTPMLPQYAIYARQTAEICGIEMLQNRTRQETEERLGLDLIDQLLSQATDEDTIVARLQRLSYDASAQRRHVAMAFGLRPHQTATPIAPGCLPPIDASADRTCQDVVNDLQWLATQEGASVLAASYRGLRLALCSISPSIPERRVHEWLRQALTTDKAKSCTVGVSRTTHGIAGLRTAIGQSVSAWELGHHVAGFASPYAYDNMGLYRLLAELRGRDELERFYQETLGELLRYDEAHDTELVHTLEIFFAENTNASQASRALYVHRNTLNYRLQRIVDIAGLDLNDAEARLALQLALKIHRLSR